MKQSASFLSTDLSCGRTFAESYEKNASASVMPQAFRMSSEMLMFDCVGTSPAFSGGGGGVGVAAVTTVPPVAVFGGGAGSEPQPAVTAVERRRIAATYFMIASLGAARFADGRGLVYLVACISAPIRKPQRGRVGNAQRVRCIPM